MPHRDPNFKLSALSIALIACGFVLSPLLHAQTPTPEPAANETKKEVAKEDGKADKSADTKASQKIETITVTDTKERSYKAESTTALGVDLPLQQLPASVSIIDQSFLRDYNIKGLNDLANYIPGVTINDNGGSPGESLLIRGFGTDNVFVDGLLTRARFGVPSSLPDVLERIEITKGPAGAEAGVAEFGGTVNLVTKKPKRAFAAEVNAGVGDYGYRKIGMDVTGSLNNAGTIQGRFIAAYEEGAEWRKGRPEKTPRYVIAPSLNVDYGEGRSVLVQVERYAQNNPLDRGIIYLEGAFPDSNFAPRDWSFHQSIGRQPLTLDKYILNWQHQISDNLTARVRLQQYDQKESNDSFRNADSEPGDGLYNADGRSWSGQREIGIFFAQWRERYRTRNANAELTGKFGIGSTSHTVRGGVEAYRLKIRPGTFFEDTSNDNSVDILNLTNNQQPVNLANGTPFIDSGLIKSDSAYATWLANWSPQWRTVVGVRSDRFSESLVSTVNNEVDFLSESSAKPLSWRVATSYDVTKNVSAFIGVSNAFQPQSGITRTGQQIDPTGGRSIEAGVKTSLFGGKALWTNSIYQITQNNIAACDKDPSLDADAIDQCRFSVLFGAARIRGFETELQGQVTQDLSLSAGFAVMQSRITKTDETYQSDISRAGQTFVGNRFANTPKFQASVAVTVDWSRAGVSGLKTTLGAVHVGQRWGDPGNTISLPGYTVVNIVASYAINRNTSMSLNIGNVLDKTYYTAMQASSDRADQVGVGDRRLVQTMLRYQF
jgi:iron complex outermembrane recepter protein